MEKKIVYVVSGTTDATYDPDYYVQGVFDTYGKAKNFLIKTAVKAMDKLDVKPEHRYCEYDGDELRYVADGFNYHVFLRLERWVVS